MVERLKHVPHKRYRLSNGVWDEQFDQPSALSRFLPTKDGNYVSDFPISESLGQHSIGETICEKIWPGAAESGDKMMRSRCGIVRCRDSTNPLLKYPIGIRLYFKMLKAFSRIFFWYSIVSCFTMLIFLHGSAWNSSQRLSLLIGTTNTARRNEQQTSSLSIGDRLKYAAFFVSLGSFGEKVSQCGNAVDGEVIELSCPYGTISSVKAFYGQPTGSCFCPYEQQLEQSTGQCPEEVKFRVEGGQRLMDGCKEANRRDGEEGYCLRGETLFGESCCAQRLTSSSTGFQSDKIPDFTNLLPRDNPTCRSDTAQYIVENVCLGKSACNVTTDFNRTFLFQPRVYKGKVLSCSALDRNTSDAHTCEESLGSFGNWSGCGNHLMSGNLHRLMVTAECKNDNIRWGKDASATKESISWFLTVVDSVLMLGLLIFLRWLEHKENIEVVETNLGLCTAADYTVVLTNLPKHSDMMALKRELAKFFEKQLSGVHPVMRTGPIEV